MFSSFGEKFNEDGSCSDTESKVNEDFWSISPEKDVDDVSSCEENEVVPFHRQHANEIDSDDSPSPVKKPLKNTLKAFEGKFDEGENIIEHVEEFIPKKKFYIEVEKI